MPPLAHLPRHAVAAFIRLYQLTLSFWLGRHCRFYPSCSAYTREAVLRFGVLQGGYLGLKRIGRCGPWAKGCSHGFDPVPDVWQKCPDNRER